MAEEEGNLYYFNPVVTDKELLALIAWVIFAVHSGVTLLSVVWFGIRRKLQPLRCRPFKLVLLECLGSVVCVWSLSYPFVSLESQTFPAYIPQSPAWQQVLTRQMQFAIFAPVIIARQYRIYEYFRVNQMMVGLSSGAVSRMASLEKRKGNTRQKFLLFCVLIWSIPVTLFHALWWLLWSQLEVNIMIYWEAFQVLCIMGSLVYLLYLFRIVKEAFHRYFGLSRRHPYLHTCDFSTQELILLVFVWLAAIANHFVGTLSQSYPSDIQIWSLMFAFFATTLISCAWPCYLSYKGVYQAPSKTGDSTNDIEMSSISSAGTSQQAVQRILEVPRTRDLLIQYCVQEFCVENVLFIQQVDLYEKMDRDDQKDEARIIFWKYVPSNAAMAVNLTARTVSAVEKNLENPEMLPTLFKKAREEIFVLIVTDIFPRFVTSNTWKTWLSRTSVDQTASDSIVFDKLKDKRQQSQKLLG